GYQTWQWMFWAELLPSVLFFIGLLCIPESPRYLVAAGRKDEASAVLDRIEGKGHGRASVEQIAATLDQNRRPSLRDLFNKAGRVHPIVWVGIIIAALQQLVGINVVFYYGEVLWRAAGFSEANALKINVIGG